LRHEFDNFTETARLANWLKLRHDAALRQREAADPQQWRAEFDRFSDNEKFTSWLGLRRRRDLAISGRLWGDVSSMKAGSGDSINLLWAYGPPGAGKTVLAAFLVEHLRKLCDEATTMAYFFCDYQSKARQGADDLLQHIAWQIIQHSDAVSDKVKAIFEDCKRQIRALDKQTLLELVELVASPFRRVFIVVDGLDESKKRKELISVLADLGYKLPIKLLITSRPIPEIQEVFQGEAQIKIEALDSDIRQYILSRIEEDDDLEDLLTSDLRNRIVDCVISKANGM
jgi:hypothetical protein